MLSVGILNPLVVRNCLLAHSRELSQLSRDITQKKNVWLLRGLKLAQDNLTLDFSRLATFQLLHIIQVQPISLVIAAFIGTSPLHAHRQPH